MTRRIDKTSLDFFHEGMVKVRTLQDFFDSYAGRYLKEVYGELEFSKTSGTNFINVYHNGTDYILHDSIFSDKCPVDNVCGFIIPVSIKSRTHRIVKSKYQCMRNLARFGYTQIDHDINIGRYVENLDYVRLGEGLDYDAPTEYFKHIKNNPDENTTIKKLEPLRDEIFSLIKERFSDNHLINKNCVAETRVQRMNQGDSMIRHFGADKNEPYIMTAISYHVPYAFMGRELYGGLRSTGDLSRYVSKFCDEPDFNSYSDQPEAYEDTFSMKPSSNSIGIVSATNPLFYHAVAEHKGGGEVYAIITDIRLK
jgi:hypothetical protein